MKRCLLAAGKFISCTKFNLMKGFISLFLLAFSSALSAQDTLCTYYGDNMSPVDTIRVLNIFINIIYDQCDTCDPLHGMNTPYWEPGPPNTVNINPPGYLADWMDSDFDPDHIRGSFTRILAQSSFNHLVVLGDHMTEKQGQRFYLQALIDSSIALINQKGGLHTINGHNSIHDYDGSVIRENLSFKKKGQDFNRKIDFVQFLVRNSTSQHGGLAINRGTSSIAVNTPLKADSFFYFFDAGTLQVVGDQNLAVPFIMLKEVHEMAHKLLGMTNVAHMGGSGPLNAGDLTTLGPNGGWSLLGGSYSSLVSCSGFDRWRLDWRGPTNRNYPIAVQNENADIVREDGPKSFSLRDFNTYGDAIRIKLPYIDSGALNQYLWLENHQIHANGMVDYPCYWEYECKDDGVPGIYAYYQVGKDIREGSYGEIMPYYTDHLIPVCADGKWDVVLDSDMFPACVAGGLIRVQEYISENPLSGYNDQGIHYFVSTEEDMLDWKKHRQEFVIKRQNGVLTNKLANLGDDQDAFTGNTFMNIASNPSPVNVVTYHHTRHANSGRINKSKRIDNRKIHLSGLRIDMKDQYDGTYKVDVYWNDYNIDRNVRWSGDIVNHERINLMSGKTITLDQNQTPNKHIRDSATGLFAGPTYFTCLKDASFFMQPSSNVTLQDLASFILEPGSKIEINDSAVFRVKEGSTLQVKNGAEIVITGSGSIEIEDGAYLCIEDGAILHLKDEQSVINLRPGFNLGRNRKVLTGIVSPVATPAAILYSGPGSVNAYYSGSGE
jgi:hypothetical protein